MNMKAVLFFIVLAHLEVLKAQCHIATIFDSNPISVLNSLSKSFLDWFWTFFFFILLLIFSQPHFYQLTSSHATESENQALKCKRPTKCSEIKPAWPASSFQHHIHVMRYVFFFFLMAKLNLLHHTDSFMARKVYQELKSKQEVINAEEQTNFFICCNPMWKRKKRKKSLCVSEKRQRQRRIGKLMITEGATQTNGKELIRGKEGLSKWRAQAGERPKTLAQISCSQSHPYEICG